MSIDHKIITKISKLARIHLTAEESARYANELNSIMSWIEQLQEVNTENIPAMAGIGDYTLRMREDNVTDIDIKDDVLANAPEAAFGCYKVPKVVE